MGIAAVTGGTGFVGSHLARLLCNRGERVRVLVRLESRVDVLAGLPVELVPGDLREPRSLPPLVEGVTVLYHVAADYRLWSPDPDELYRSNVDGTANILAAAQEASVPRVVYTSTVGCLGIPRDGSPGDESTPVKPEDMIGHYKRSKFLAEQVALEHARQGLSVVVVNPTAPVGPGDHKPTPTGKVILDFLRGGMPAFMDTGLNLVDVRDVAVGHVLAAENGRSGERYILGARNVTLQELLSMAAAACGRKPPAWRIPHWAAFAVGALSTLCSRVTGRPPRVSLEGVRMSRKRMFFSADKAVRELDLPQSSVEAAVADAVRWFFGNGYVGRVR